MRKRIFRLIINLFGQKFAGKIAKNRILAKHPTAFCYAVTDSNIHSADYIIVKSPHGKEKSSLRYAAIEIGEKLFLTISEWEKQEYLAWISSYMQYTDQLKRIVELSKRR